MATNIQALERGGFSAYGSAWTDDRLRVVYVQAMLDEAHPITVTFPSEISTVVEEEGSANTTTPSITGSSFTATLTDMTDGTRVEYLVTLTTGEIRRLRIVGSYRERDRYSDYGWGI